MISRSAVKSLKNEPPEIVPLPQEIVNVSHYRQKAGLQPVPRKILPHMECVELLTHGRGWVRDGEDWRELLPGDLVWNSPGDETIGRSDPVRPYGCLAVVFKVRPVKGRGIRRFSIWPDQQEVRRLTEQAVRAFLDPSFDRHTLMGYLQGTLLFKVRCYEALRKVERYPEGVRLVLDRIERGYGESLSIQDLARDAGWSPPHLHAVFRAHVGNTPHQSLIERRLRAAKEKLVSTTDSVKEIAGACGFSDAPAFVHAFKKSSGVTPVVFRSHYLRGPSLRE